LELFLLRQDYISTLRLFKKVSLLLLLRHLSHLILYGAVLELEIGDTPRLINLLRLNWHTYVFVILQGTVFLAGIFFNFADIMKL
jgi:hypothetical protein